jgi:hypothetical protein
MVIIFILIVAIASLSAFLYKGEPKPEIRKFFGPKLWLLAIALIIHVLRLINVAETLFSGQALTVAKITAFIMEAGFIGIYALLVIKMPGIWLMVAGGITNALAILSNGGLMPVQHSAAAAAGLEKGLASPSVEHFLTGRTAPFWFLGDIFPFKLGLAFVYSVGDVLIIVGVFIAIRAAIINLLIKKKKSKRILIA